MSKVIKDQSSTVPSPDAATANHSIAKSANNFPTMQPPSTSGVSVFVNGQKVVQTFGSANDQNQWLNITGAGWKKIINTSSSANIALTILGNHAKQLNSLINYRIEADNMVHEIYAW